MNTLRLVLIGKTGAGKSKTGDKILNRKHFTSSSQGKSLTKVCKLRDNEVLGRYVSVVDTPGLLDTSKEENESLSEITRSIHMSAPGPHAFILVVPIGRFTAEDLYTMEKFVKHFGKELFKYIIVAFTRFDDYQRDLKNKGITDCDIKNYVLTLPDKVKEFINVKCHGRVIGIDNTLEGSESEKQIQQLLKLVDVIMAQNQNSFYTNEDYNNAEQLIKRETIRQQERSEKKCKEQSELMEKTFGAVVDATAYQRLQSKMHHLELEVKQKIECERSFRDYQQNSRWK